ncbi:MAG: MBL fold metallo-hydrolase [Clostridia bacterium]|nr:MBL fold metallo-hydrolase [Clostridia bacterium]
MLVKETENIVGYLYQIEIENTGHITNTYVIKDKVTTKLAVIDPAFDGKNIKRIIKELGELECVIITHSHADHIAGLAELVNDTNAKVYIHPLDKEGLWNERFNEEKVVGTKVLPIEEKSIREVEENDKIELGNTTLFVMHTPGHTQGSMVVYIEKENILFAGDTIFKNSYGRTDLITGSTEAMGKSLDKLFNKFHNIEVYPGHGEIFELINSKRRIKMLFAFK